MQRDQRVIACLLASKAVNVPYDMAWGRAVAKYPPRDRGETQLSLVSDSDEIGHEEFLYSVCWNAWHNVEMLPGSGNGPALRGFSIDMLLGSMDHSRFAVAGGHTRAA